MFKNYSMKTFLKDTVIDVVGCSIYAVGIICFAAPALFAPGGVNGLSVIINYLTDFEVGTIQMVLNIPLVLISFRILGKKFIFKTLKTMIILSIFLNVFPYILPVYTGDRLIAALVTGVTDGLGLGLIYLNGGSSGGSDFLTLSIRKKKPHMSVGFLNIIINAFVMVAGVFAFKDIDAALYGGVSVIIAGIVCDKILYGAGQGKMSIIITDKGEEIAKAIGEVTGRGSSVFNVTGAYTGKTRSAVLSAVSKDQIFTIRRLAHKIDEKSFVIISTTDEVFGEGFMDNID